MQVRTIVEALCRAGLAAPAHAGVPDPALRAAAAAYFGQLEPAIGGALQGLASVHWSGADGASWAIS
jgi:hypothetical protein